MNNEGKLFLSFGNEEFTIQLQAGDSVGMIKIKIKDHLNEHGDHTATIEKDGGIKYGLAANIYINT